MGYRGHIKNGVVEFEAPVPLPEGAEVEVIASQSGNGEKPIECTPEAEGEIPTLYEQLKDFIGIGNGLPKDMAKNHDHYLYGVPKK